MYTRNAYESHPQWSSAPHHFKPSNVVEVRDGLMFNFYPGLPLMCSSSIQHWGEGERSTWCPLLHHTPISLDSLHYYSTTLEVQQISVHLLKGYIAVLYMLLVRPVWADLKSYRNSITLTVTVFINSFKAVSKLQLNNYVIHLPIIVWTNMLFFASKELNVRTSLFTHSMVGGRCLSHVRICQLT